MILYFLSRRRKIVSNPYLLATGIGVVILSAIGLVRRRYVRRRQGFRRFLEQHQQSELALVRYVMLKRQCSEEQAYQRIATFVKTRSPAEDCSAIARLLTNDRQSLLEKAGSILVRHPNEIDTI